MSANESNQISSVLIATLAAAAALGLAAYLGGAVITLTTARTLPDPVATVTGMMSAPWHTGSPAEGFPGPVARSVPTARWFWTILALTALATVAVAIAAGMRIDALRGRRHLALRPYDPRRKLTPRAFARPRDLLHLRTGLQDSWTMLRLDRRLIGTLPESHVLAIAPTRAGKTTGPVTTWTLEHSGPAIITSTKPDIAVLTAHARAAHGPVWIYAPGVPDTALPFPACGWTPLMGCEHWEHAQMTARWLASTDATAGGRQSDGARFYTHEAGRLLAPLLHAAALGGENMQSVNRWLRGSHEPAHTILAGRQAVAAAALLHDFGTMEPRARSLTIATAGQLIDAYEYDSLAATDRIDFDPEQLLTGGTLYLIAPESRQAIVGPLFAALLSQIFRCVEMNHITHGPLSPELRVILDETRHLAALEDLPHLLAASASWGMRIATVWQNLDQIASRYGEQTHTILTNSAAKLFLGPIHDRGTREYLVELMDAERTEDVTYDLHTLSGRTPRTSHVRETQKASAQTLQQLPRGEGILIHGSDLPIKGRSLPYWQRRDLTRILSRHVPTPESTTPNDSGR